MLTIKCPNCGHVFEEDESKFSSIVQQVRDQAFERELEKRLAPVREAHDQELAAVRAELTAKLTDEQSRALGERDVRIAQLEEQVASSEEAHEAKLRSAVTEATEQARAESAELSHRLEMEQERARRLEEAAKESERDHARELAQEKAQLEARLEAERSKEVGERDVLIARLREQLASGERELDAKVHAAVAEATEQAGTKALKLTHQLDMERERIKRLEDEKRVQAEEHERALADVVRMKDAEIERVQNFRQRLSTKMLGESLEQHCETEFNRLRATAFRGALFEKDTVAVADEDESRGTKGDYIFRDFDEEGREFVSVMFEMKTESDAAGKKRTNESHLAKLDRDRAKKGCEYAVLVSTLEPDSELYNQGIVDVSYLYPKTYVIRPQFFIPLLTLLRDANRSSVELRRELAEAREERVDITNFEDALKSFQVDFGASVEHAGKKFDEAMDGIDRAIKQLEKIREAFRLTKKHLNTANNKADRLSIKRLTKESPLLAERFEEVRQERERAMDVRVDTVDE